MPGPELPIPAERGAARWVLGAMAFILLGLTVRLACLQLRGDLAGKAERQQIRERALPARRGEIRDREGKPLAITLMVPSIYAEPRMLAKEAAGKLPGIARALASALGLDPRRVLADLRKDRAFIWIKRQALEKEWDRLEALKLPGVGMRLEPRRFYPQGSLAGPLLGGTGIDGQPLAALELAYQSDLAGTPGRQRLTRDARGRGILEDLDDLAPPEDGNILVTTLDTAIQAVAEQALDHLLARCPCKGAVAMVLDPPTGEILAMASRPGYDPNRPGTIRPELFQNPGILLCYEPGSTFKPFIVAPALAEGLVRPEERLFCHHGAWQAPGRRQPLHDYHHHGWLTVSDVVAKSSNIGAAQIGQRLGMPRIQAYLKGFGFGQRTGVDLPGEQAGILNPPARWSKATITSVPMGHEVAVTPLQLLAAFNCFANGGRWVQPHLMKEIRKADGTVLRTRQGPPPRQVLPPELVRGPVLDMLKAVVERGTGKAARLQGVSSAGKTGTAQKLGPDGRYLHDAWVSSYVGFAPAERPRLTVLVVVDEPANRQGGYTGGAVAAPVAREILASALKLRSRPSAFPLLPAR